jgi:uncharacterized membrane protein YesL
MRVNYHSVGDVFVGKEIVAFIMEWIWRLLWINLLWILFSLPILTIIPSTFAMYAVIIKLIKEDADSDIFPLFVKEFKKYLFKSFPLGITLVLISMFLYVDLMILKDQMNSLLLILRYAILILTILLLPIICYSIPIFIELEVPWYKVMPIAFIFAMKKPLPIFLAICGILGVLFLFLFLTGFGVLLFGSLYAFFTTRAALSSIKIES